MSSYLESSLKLILSDSVNMPDDEYTALSGIFNTYGLNEIDNSYGIINILAALAKQKRKDSLEFPMTLETLEYEVNQDTVVVDFNKYIVPLVNLGFITLTRDKEQPNIVIVTNTEKLDYIIDTLLDVLVVYDNDLVGVSEGVKLEASYPAYVNDFVKRVYNVLDDLDIETQLESYSVEDNLFNISLNLLRCSNYRISSNDLTKLAKSYLSTGNKDVVAFDCYKDGKNELFISLDFKLDARKFSDIAVDIYNLVEKLELDYVK